MAKFIFGMMQSLDGYVAGAPEGPKLPMPGPELHRYFNQIARDAAGGLYGRRMYQLMRYWDEDHPEWDEPAADFAQAWRAMPKWVVSRSLESVGPNATLISDDIEASIRRLKTDVEGVIEVAGPELAGSLTDLGLIDEYHLYLRPFVLGGGKPFFAGARPPLHLVASGFILEDAVKLVGIPEPFPHPSAVWAPVRASQ